MTQNVDHCFLTATATISESMLTHSAFTMLSLLIHAHGPAVIEGNNAVADLEALNELAGMIDLKLEGAGATGDGSLELDGVEVKAVG